MRNGLALALTFVLAGSGCISDTAGQFAKERSSPAAAASGTGACLFIEGCTDDTDAATSSVDQGPRVSTADGYLILQLRDPPLASYDGGIAGLAPTRPAAGSRLDLGSPAALAYGSYLADGRAGVRGFLHSRAPGVEVVAEYSIVLNAIALRLNGAGAPAVSSAPGVASVSRSYLYSPAMNRSPTLVGAPTLWSAVGGQSNAGAGVKIGIIDTGIDQTHPFLTDSSLVVPSGFPKCDAIDSAVGVADTACKFVSNKVIVAKVFQTATAFDAHAAQAHGSHVSGIAAGVASTCAPFVGCTLSGIAPKAFLGNYNVFPDNVLSASSHDIAKAVEEAVSDGMDVLNLSLGGGARPDDVLVNAVNHAVDAGLVVAIAAGNAGPAPGTIESPGIADKVITVGASTNPHFIGIPVAVPGLGTFGAAVGQFHNFVPKVTATPYTTTTPGNGCTAISTSLGGKIALIQRGTCTFSTKIRNAQTAGAIGVIVYNNVLGDPVAMGQDGTPSQPTIPAAMVSGTNGLAMAANTTKTVTVDGTSPQEFFTDDPSADILAGFSSIGPPLLQDPGGGVGQPQPKIKPDVTAPGVNVYSSVPSFACASPPCFAFFQGTSMATPHVAGSAALLRQLHPGWSPEQIKSALVNVAHRPVRSFRSGNALLNPMSRGGGRIDLAAASTVPFTLADTGEAFGTIPIGAQNFSAQAAIGVTSVETSTDTLTISVAPVQSTGPILTVSPTSLTLFGGASGSFTATLTKTGVDPAGDFFGDIKITGAGTARVPYWVRVGSPP